MSADDLDDFPEGGVSDEFRRGVAFAELCHRQAEADHAETNALALAGRRAAVVSWPRLVAAFEYHHLAAGMGHEAALAEARREAAWLVLTARATPAGAAMATLDRLDDAVGALAAERDDARVARDAHHATTLRHIEAAEWLGAENDALRERIARAVAELDAAPDPADPEKPSRREAKAMAEANLRAWHVLTEERDPPSRRRAEDAPRDAEENAP